MKNAFMKRSVLALFLYCLSLAANAQPAIEAFSNCIADNSSGKDRKEMARWIFVSMGAHPEIKSIASISATAPEETSKTMGELVTRLLGENCPREAKLAIEVAGPNALEAGFKLLGELAMRELMTNKEVSISLGLYEKYLNKEKMIQAFTKN